MKISKLKIDHHKHLENLDFDFTYPEDFYIEEKRGKPLDKICFIGQSATGKTGLLELIYDKVIKIFYYEKSEEQTRLDTIELSENFDVNLEFVVNESKFKGDRENIYYGQSYLVSNKVNSSRIANKNDLRDIFYFKSNLISDKNIEIFNINPLDIIQKYEIEFNTIQYQYNIKQNYRLLFDDNVNPNIWIFILIDILNYRKNFTQKMSEMIRSGLAQNQDKFFKEFEKWQKDNPNKLEDFATIFNPILEKLHLEVDLVDTQFSIPIRNKRNDEIIAIRDTSTGTKGLLLSILPLFKLDTKESIILIDEPERSLYPDLQMELMEHYQNLAPEAQFIVATHSPFIAASFEPEERFVLSFDEKGKVVVNRGTSPRGDDPNDMLHNDFGVNYINKYGQEKHTEYIDLKQKIFFEKDETIKKEYAEKLEKIGETYNL